MIDGPRPGVSYTQCRTCHAQIFFAWTAKGKHIPIDAAANPNGNLVVLMRNGRPLAETWDRHAHGDAIRRTSHFATCPQSKEHRRQR